MKKILVVVTLFICVNADVLSQNLNVQYDTTVKLRTKSGMLYKIIPASNESPLLQTGQVAKFNHVVKLGDSILYSSYGDTPGYVKLKDATSSYDLLEILPMMKQDDSAVIVQSVDTFMRRGLLLPPDMQRSDMVTTTLHILQSFSSDSLARKDFDDEAKRIQPKKQREKDEQMARVLQDIKEKQRQREQEAKESGEMSKEIKEMESYLSARKIKARKTGKGTYVLVKQSGLGAFADSGKYVTVKYKGRILKTDSVFQSSRFTFQLGVDPVITGWDEGIRLFKKGGSGTLYVPGFLAYGKNPPEGSPIEPDQALIFDITIVDIKKNK